MFEFKKMEPARTKARGTQGRNTKAALIPALRGGVCERRSIKIGKKYIQGFVLKLGSKNLMVLRGAKGYVMCGYLNMAVANKFKDIAVKIIGVSTIEEALKSKVHSCSYRALKIGIRQGQPVKEVLKVIA